MADNPMVRFDHSIARELQVSMAENEYLDSSKSRHWYRLVRDVAADAGPKELAECMMGRFCKTLRVIAKDIQLGELIRLARVPGELDRICATFDGAVDVKSRLRYAASETSDQRSTIRRFLELSLDKCLNDIPFLVRKVNPDTNISDVRRRMNAARSQPQFSGQMDLLAKRLESNPNWKPRCVGDRRKRSGTQSATEKMLSESLILGSSKR
jgi:hypothetical protein